MKIKNYLVDYTTNLSNGLWIVDICSIYDYETKKEIDFTTLSKEDQILIKNKCKWNKANINYNYSLN
jgi:hypothetical protein